MTEEEKAAGREVFRYRRADEVRIYSLHLFPDRAELWRVTVRPGEPDHAIKEEDFRSVDAAVPFFDEVQRTLTAGGWRVSQ